MKQEKHLIAECDCPFMVKLIAGFQDANYLYMLLEAAMGGEFFTYMQVRSFLWLRWFLQRNVAACASSNARKAQMPSISAAAPALIVSQSTERLHQSLSRAVTVTFLMTFCLHAESAGCNPRAGSAVLRRRRSAGPGIHAAPRPRLAVRLEFRVSEPESSPAEAVRDTCRHTGLRRGRRCACNSVQNPTEEMLPTPNRYKLEP